MSEQPSKIGYLLINLGTPDSPEVKDVRRYLGEFLMDLTYSTCLGRSERSSSTPLFCLFDPRTVPRPIAKSGPRKALPFLVMSQALADKLQEPLGRAGGIEYALWQTLHCRRPVDPARKRRDSSLHRTPVPHYTPRSEPQ